MSFLAVGLLCLRKAKSGGLSTWSSQITAHNEMLLRGRKVSDELCLYLALNPVVLYPIFRARCGVSVSQVRAVVALPAISASKVPCRTDDLQL